MTSNLRMSIKILVLLLWLAKANSEFNVNIWPSSGLHVALQNSSHVFACQVDLLVDFDTSATIRWIRPDKYEVVQFSPDLKEKIYFIKDDTLRTSLVYLNLVQSSDEGEYYCEVLASGKRQHKSITLIVTKSDGDVNMPTPANSSTHGKEKDDDFSQLLPPSRNFIIFELWDQIKLAMERHNIIEPASDQGQSNVGLMSRILLPSNWF